MRLAPNELRSRAAAFARDWQAAHYEKGETQSFWNAFFQIFGIERKRVAVYEHSVDKLKGGRGFIDLLNGSFIGARQRAVGLIAINLGIRNGCLLNIFPADN